MPIWCNIFYRKALNIFCCLHLFPHISNITTQCRVQPCKVLQNGIQIWPPSCYISPGDVLILYLHLHEPEAFTVYCALTETGRLWPAFLLCSNCSVSECQCCQLFRNDLSQIKHASNGNGCHRLKMLCNTQKRCLLVLYHVTKLIIQLLSIINGCFIKLFG